MKAPRLILETLPVCFSRAPILFASLKSFPALSKPCAALISSVVLPAPPTNWSHARIVLTPTCNLYHFRLVGTLRKTGWMPLDYASFQIGKGQLKSAIETLERGRTLMCSDGKVRF